MGKEKNWWIERDPHQAEENHLNAIPSKSPNVATVCENICKTPLKIERGAWILVEPRLCLHLDLSLCSAFGQFWVRMRACVSFNSWRAVIASELLKQSKAFSSYIAFPVCNLRLQGLWFELRMLSCYIFSFLLSQMRIARNVQVEPKFVLDSFPSFSLK